MAKSAALPASSRERPKAREPRRAQSKKADPYADVRAFVADEAIAEFKAELDTYIADWRAKMERIIWHARHPERPESGKRSAR